MDDNNAQTHRQESGQTGDGISGIGEDRNQTLQDERAETQGTRPDGESEGWVSIIPER